MEIILRAYFWHENNLQVVYQASMENGVQAINKP